mgnify:FL=1
MRAYITYPDGWLPSAGPFSIISDEKRSADVIHFESREVALKIRNGKTTLAQFMNPSEARELAAALIECADYIDRQNMTAEDKAKDAGDGR